MNEIWKTTQMEIVQYILKMEGSLKYRNGQYIPQISKNDDRYNLLLTIPVKEYNTFTFDDHIYHFIYVYFYVKNYKIVVSNFNMHIITDDMIHHLFSNGTIYYSENP